jgi:glycosyltransferase involved in cell wall biosynthesis
MVKILFLVSNFPPEISTGRLEDELSQSLAGNGHEITVVTAFPRPYLVDKPVFHSNKLLYRESRGNVNVVRVGPTFSDRDNLNSRGFEYFFQLFSFFVGGLVSGKSDIIICSSPPLTLALAGYFLGKIKRIPVIVRVGDLHPQELIDMGLVKGNFLKWILETIESFVYRKINFFTSLSKGYRKHMIQRGAKPSKVSVVPNWGNIDCVDNSVVPKSCRQDDDNSEKFLLTYAGTMSWFQDLETVVKAANILRNQKNIRFLLVGDGPQKKLLQERCSKFQLDNLAFLPLQPKKEYFQLLQDSDACLVSINKDVKTTSIPSKLLDIMACGKPVVANVPSAEVHELVRDAECGVCVEPGNPEVLADVLLKLSSDKSYSLRLGANAREYVERHLSLDSCTLKFLEIIDELVGNR